MALKTVNISKLLKSLISKVLLYETVCFPKHNILRKIQNMQEPKN